MTIASTASGKQDSNTSTTTIVCSSNVNAAVDTFVVVFVASDNLASVDGDNNEVSISDSAGNAYYKIVERTNSQGGAALGVTFSAWRAVITSALSSGSITATFSSAVVSKCMHWNCFSKVASNQVLIENATTWDVDGGNVVSRTLPTMPSREYLFIRAEAGEGSANGTNTVNWTTIESNNSSSIMLFTERLIQTRTEPQWASNPSQGTSTDRVEAMFAIYEAAASTSNKAIYLGATF